MDFESISLAARTQCQMLVTQPVLIDAVRLDVAKPVVGTLAEARTSDADVHACVCLCALFCACVRVCVFHAPTEAGRTKREEDRE